MIASDAQREVLRQRYDVQNNLPWSISAVFMIAAHKRSKIERENELWHSE